MLANLAAHKVRGVRQAIAAAGALLLHLTPYSPDLNPIEQLFAKLKALLRKVAAPQQGRIVVDYQPPPRRLHRRRTRRLPPSLRTWLY